jgi:NAD(P)-dependent dehydrogenase (short-subunit alcohol dehydrogenase family)
MPQSENFATNSSVQDVTLIIGGGPGISSSCARLFAKSGMRVGIAARNPDKSALEQLEKLHGVRRYPCDASYPTAVELLFRNVVRDLGAPTLVVHNIDGRVAGIFRKGIAEADPGMALETLRNAAFSAFLVGQQAARVMAENKPNANGAKGTIIFTNASAALKGFPASGAFARIDAAGHSRRQCSDRRRDRLDPGRRHARTSAGGNDSRRQHGRPRPHRRNLSAAPSTASVDMGIRSRAPALARKMVTGVAAAQI